jgi:hypothetical protein
MLLIGGPSEGEGWQVAGVGPRDKVKKDILNSHDQLAELGTVSS